MRLLHVEVIPRLDRARTRARPASHTSAPPRASTDPTGRAHRRARLCRRWLSKSAVVTSPSESGGCPLSRACHARSVGNFRQNNFRSQGVEPDRAVVSSLAAPLARVSSSRSINASRHHRFVLSHRAVRAQRREGLPHAHRPTPSTRTSRRKRGRRVAARSRAANASLRPVTTSPRLRSSSRRRATVIDDTPSSTCAMSASTRSFAVVFPGSAGSAAVAIVVFAALLLARGDHALQRRARRGRPRSTARSAARSTARSTARSPARSTARSAAGRSTSRRPGPPPDASPSPPPGLLATSAGSRSVVAGIAGDVFSYRGPARSLTSTTSSVPTTSTPYSSNGARGLGAAAREARPRPRRDLEFVFVFASRGARGLRPRLLVRGPSRVAPSATARR